jgi:membrane-bound metal-dependent hydrolase YbcI (DUF457 family)
VFGAVLSLTTGNVLDGAFFYIGNAFPDIDVLWNSKSVRQKEYKTSWYSHRGITHSLALLTISFLVAVVLFSLSKEGKVSVETARAVLFFSLGYANHLFFDAMSPTGIPKTFAYYPRVKLWTLYKVRSASEYLLVFFSVLVAVAVAFPFLKHSELMRTILTLAGGKW